ncbi:MAG: hypothetical protein AB8B85_12115 [Paracoccaceae bacterium]
MTELSDRSAVLADFVDNWKRVGGPSCRLDDLMVPGVSASGIVVCLKDGEWRYHYTGELHQKINGLTLRGRVRDQIPPHIWCRTSTLYQRCLKTHMPQMIETTGHVGRSVDILFKIARVVCAPPEGAEAAIAGVVEWDFEMDHAQEEVLAELVCRCAGPALREQFLSDRPGVVRVSGQLALLRELVEGAYGNLSPADRTYLQVYLLGLYSEYDTDGQALYHIH